MIEAMAWDFGGVLAAFSHRRACEQIAALSAGRFSADAISDWIFASGRHVRLEDGTLSADVFLAELVSRFEIAAPPQVVERAYSDIFVPMLAVCDLSARLPPDFPQYLASNTDPCHWSVISALMAEVFGAFRQFVLSFEVGARKPSAKFFTALLDRAGCAAEALLFVDDLADNVAGARAVGIDAIVFESAAALQRELSVRGIVPGRQGSG